MSSIYSILAYTSTLPSATSLKINKIQRDKEIAYGMEWNRLYVFCVHLLASFPDTSQVSEYSCYNSWMSLMTGPEHITSQTEEWLNIRGKGISESLKDIFVGYFPKIVHQHFL